MKKLIILLSFAFGIGLTTVDAQTTPKNGVTSSPATTQGAVTHRRQHGLISVSESKAKGGSKSSTSVKTVKTKPAKTNGNKSAQDAWDAK